MNKRIIAAILLTLALAAVVGITALTAYRTGMAQGTARAPEVAEQLRLRREQVAQPPRAQPAPPAQPVPEGAPPVNGGPRSAGPGPNGPPPYMQQGQYPQGPWGPGMMGRGMQTQRGYNNMPGMNRGMQMQRGPGLGGLLTLMLLGLIAFLLWRTYARGAGRGPRWGGPGMHDHQGPPPWFEAWHRKAHEPQAPSTPEV